MTFHALAIDDDPGILDDVKDRLEALGHTCDCVACMTCAREHLAKNTYSYILLDLEIPVRYGRPSRIPNGQNLLREIRSMKGYKDIPIIVMTTHGHDSPDLAVDVLRCDGASDFVKKSFSDRGHTLEKAIHDALATSGRSRPGAAKRSGAAKNQPPQPFEYGEMVFSESRVELCEVKICGGAESGMIRRILDELRNTNTCGTFVAYSGTELARRVKCPAGQNGVAGAVREFRKKTADLLLEEASVQCGPRDIIQSGGRGYRFTEKIAVRGADGPANEPHSGNSDAVNRPLNDVVNSGDDLENNPRQQWALERMRANGEFRKADVIAQFKCSNTTAERDLRDLRRRGIIEFIGPAKTGHWRLVC